MFPKQQCISLLFCLLFQKFDSVSCSLLHHTLQHILSHINVHIVKLCLGFCVQGLLFLVFILWYPCSFHVSFVSLVSKYIFSLVSMVSHFVHLFLIQLLFTLCIFRPVFSSVFVHSCQDMFCFAILLHFPFSHGWFVQYLPHVYTYIQYVCVE